MKLSKQYAEDALYNWRIDDKTKLSQEAVIVIATEAALKAAVDAYADAADVAAKESTNQGRMSRDYVEKCASSKEYEYGLYVAAVVRDAIRDRARKLK